MLYAILFIVFFVFLQVISRIIQEHGLTIYIRLSYYSIR
jgi:hypothetical protein